MLTNIPHGVNNFFVNINVYKVHILYIKEIVLYIHNLFVADIERLQIDTYLSKNK